MSYNLVENFYDLQRYVKTCADRANLSVVWGKPDDTPCTDGKRVLIPRPDSSWDADKLERLKYSAAHEVAHVLYTDFDYPPEEDKKVDMQTKFGMVWNLIEDHRIDYLNSMVYAGDYALCRSSYANCYEQLVLKNINDDVLAGAVLGNMMFAKTWLPELVEISESQYADASPEIRELADKFVDVCSELIDMARNNDTLEGTGLTYMATVAYMPEEDRKEAEDKAKSKAEGGDGDADGSDGEPSKVDKATEDMVERMSKAMTGTPDMSRDKSDEIKSKIDVDNDRYDEDYIPDTLQDIMIEDFVNNKFTIMNKEPRTDVLNFINKHSHNAAGIANKLRTKLQILSRSRTKYGTKSGKLHANALHRICIPDGGEYSERIFKRKEDALNLDVSVTVLLDMSGSMNNDDKYEHASLATVLLNEALGTTLRVPLEILGFTESNRSGGGGYGGGAGMKTHIAVLKNFNSAMPKQRIVNALGVCSHYLYENTDGEAIMFAHDRLMRQRTKRKVLFVLSDGDPAGGYSKGNIKSFTRKVIKHIQERSPVEIYGIGFMSHAVERYYKHHAIINKADEIESKLVEVVSKKVFGV